MTPPLPDLEEARKILRENNRALSNADSAIVPIQRLLLDISAFAARVRQEERERCAKAVCYGCRIGHPFEDEARTFHHVGPLHGPKDAEEGCGFCRAVAIRLLDGGKEGE